MRKEKVANENRKNKLKIGKRNIALYIFRLSFKTSFPTKQLPSKVSP